MENWADTPSMATWCHRAGRQNTPYSPQSIIMDLPVCLGKGHLAMSSSHLDPLAAGPEETPGRPSRGCSRCYTKQQASAPAAWETASTLRAPNQAFRPRRSDKVQITAFQLHAANLSGHSKGLAAALCHSAVGRKGPLRGPEEQGCARQGPTHPHSRESCYQPSKKGSSPGLPKTWAGRGRPEHIQ